MQSDPTHPTLSTENETARAAGLAMRENAQRLRLALDAADLGDWDWNPHTDAMTLSPRAARIFGLPADVVMTRTQMRELLHDQDRPKAKIALDQSCSQRTDYDIEYRVTRPSDQRQVWIAAKGRGIYDSGGTLTRMLGVVQDITAKKVAEQERENLLRQVKAERARLEAVFELSPSFMTVLRGPQHVFELANDHYYQLVGHRDLIGRPAREAIPEVEGQGFFEILDRVYSTGEPFVGKDVLIKLQRQPGAPLEERCIEFVYQPTRDPNGSITGIFVHGVDLTERKRVEDRLARDAMLLANVRDSVIVTDLDGIVTFWNEGATRLFGWKAAEVMGRHYADRLPEPSRTEVTAWIRKIAAEEAEFEGEWLDFRRDGSRVWIEAITRRVTDAGGRPMHIMGVARDISERKRAEAFLRESDERHRGVLAALEEGVLLHDANGTIVMANASAERILGLTLDQLRGRDSFDSRRQSMAEDGSEPPGDQHPSLSAVRTGQTVTNYVMAVRRPDGAEVWVSVNAVPLRDAGTGSVTGAVTSFFDITRRRQIEQERERLLEAERIAREHAERASRLKDEFLANLSHELRTPLNAILGWSQILAQGTKDPDDLAEGLRTIERNARAQTQIIGDLLDMSRIVSGKVRLDMQRVDLGLVVQEAVETARPAADAKGIRFNTVIDPLAGPVSGDPSRLQQVMWNLLNNAVKFSPRGSRVQVLLERLNSHLDVSVIDAGEGISPEFLPFVFDRFRQSDASTTRRHGGLGLGLAIVKQLIEMHGGSIRAKSPGVGQGATFVVSLPLVPTPTEPELSEAHLHPGAADRPAQPDVREQIKGVRVLVVDDELDSRALIKRLLEDCDAIVTVAQSAAEGMELLQSHRPDVLVCDIGMPMEDGYALIRRVRGLGEAAGGNTPAVALTAYARSEDRIGAITAGFEFHVAKPVEPQELIAMIANLRKRMR